MGSSLKFFFRAKKCNFALVCTTLKCNLPNAGNLNLNAPEEERREEATVRDFATHKSVLPDFRIVQV